MTRQTRREFLENSMFAATAAALAGGGLAAPARAEGQSSSPNERFADRSCGAERTRPIAFGWFHAAQGLRRSRRRLRDPRDELVGQNKGVAVVEEATGNKPAFYADLRKLLEDKSVDIISIATPNHWHALAAIWGIQAGKDVVCRKAGQS